MTFDDGKRYFFDGFTLDPAERSLSRNGEEISLPGKVFDVLVVLARNPGRLLRKEELIENVWPEEFVEEANLARSVSTLRKALSDTGREHKYIATIQGQGYRFVADISSIGENDKSAGSGSSQGEFRGRSIRWVLLVGIVAILLSIGWYARERLIASDPSVKSLAVLPLNRLGGSDNYLGIGIADAVIRKISQSKQITVRPTSAILRYADSGTDTLAAAKELKTDAVLEGTIQSDGDRMRISINLLRTDDGTSLWTDKIDMPAADIFAIEDNVAQQVVSRLRLPIDGTISSVAHFTYPANTTAYEFYIKGLFSLDQRGGNESLPQMEKTIDLFKSSIEADPNYAPAHAQLAWAYAWTAQLIDASNPKWADLASQEIKRADELDTQIAETHLAKAMLYWSRYGNYQYDAIIRELKIAKELNPNSTHGEPAGTLAHLGLVNEASNELHQEMEVDPASESLKQLTIILPYLRGDADEWFAQRQKMRPSEFKYLEPWYYLRKGDLIAAKWAIDERTPKGQKYPDFQMTQALFLALSGNRVEAEARVPGIVTQIPTEDQERHHVTYDAACIYALSGKNAEAVKWLRETANSGFPNYPLFAQDKFLDPIRNSPEFIQFLSEQKAQWERFRREYYEQN